MATKHMNAAPGDFADTVLMPGDPLRAQYIADTYLDDARRVTDVRNMWGFTGTCRGQPISVMAHGMGIPSASIYVTELIESYGVKRVIRVGSCGTSHSDVKLRDIVIGQGADERAVLVVKRMLRKIGYDTVPLSPGFDADTLEAIRDFQARHHLSVDALVGPLTKIMLLREVNATGMPLLKETLRTGS